MTTIQFACEHCKKSLKVSAEKAGARARCPGCKQAVTVPAVQADPHRRIEEAAGQVDRGRLATNISAVERLQASVLPVKEPPSAGGEPREEPVGEVRRFQVPAATWSWVAFSPDGRRVLYCGLSPSTPNSPKNENW